MKDLTNLGQAAIMRNMKTVNVYEAKTHFSQLLEAIARGEKIVIAKNGVPVADLQPHKPHKAKLKFGVMAGKLHYKEADFTGTDPDIQKMFYG